ncbi:PREDICTED: F-box/WD repeat-containing protein 7-like [Papilio xuthus]|uniref:F-box/WD repeat-containing protein 7 n=1 Tax=Papilio xuthus TaxID=66420 RepID=A0A194PG49_PAPXU|nr:PREDICTED: F-box/WD repeat-containing protein 7-like [Papilio xuthus]XP_013161908.1 PREDICTED: F-box/WD repeat-containing protein 7-like [Papilio xuthus]KPI92003.1 F-box/WD repeat-containing protein 7 [Papilio xuthus]
MDENNGANADNVEQPTNPCFRERIDDIEREDFEEENRIIKHCSNLMMEGELTASSHFSGNLSSINSSLASSSETISTLSTFTANESNLPGCSKSDDIEDCDIPLKYLNHEQTIGFSTGKETKKVDFMEKLLNSGIPEKKDIPRGKLYKGDCDNEIADSSDMESASSSSGQTSQATSSSSDSSGFSVPSTSNAERLLGLGSSGLNSHHTVTSSFLRKYSEDEDDSDDEIGVGNLRCTCNSPHADDDEDDELDLDQRAGCKRRYESTPQNTIKRFCTDGGISAVATLECKPNTTNPNIIAQKVQASPELKQWLHRFQTWSTKEKTLAIDALVTRCAASDVRYMMKAIEPLFQRDFISLLPKELALTVLGYLSPKDLLMAAQTCRYWRFLADDNLLWKEKCRRAGITELKKIPRNIPRFASPWKATYMSQTIIENNWMNKSVLNPIIMRGHDDHVITCLQFQGNRILSGSDDTTLKLWSANSGKCLHTLVGHTGGVWSSQMVGDLVISGSTDRTLRVWNANTGQCLKVLAGHTSTVRCMHLYQNRVVSGSRDATLRVWSIPDGRCLRVLVGHLAAVRCVQYDGKVVVSGAYDYFVKVWNPDTGDCLHTLAGHTNRVYSLQFDGIHVVSGSLDTSIRVWDVETGQLKHTLTGHQSLTSGMELHSNILVSGNADSTVKVWDISSGHCLHTLSGPNKHQSAVTCLQSSNRFVITSSDDGTVKLWDVRTGEFIRNLVELSSGGSGGVVWRIRASATKLICAVGSRNGTEETKLLLLDFDVAGTCRKCDE